MTKRGCGILFYDRRNRRMLFYRRDNKSTIRYPNKIDIIGGGIEEGETPDETIVREVAEELHDRRTSQPFRLEGYTLFKSYTDRLETEQYIFCKEANFEITDLRLDEGQYLLWLTEEEARTTDFAFDFSAVVMEFFKNFL